MTIREYNRLKSGDKIMIMKYFDKGRIITLKEPYGTHCKFTSEGNKGFMVGNIFYHYQDCKVIKEEQ